MITFGAPFGRWLIFGDGLYVDSCIVGFAMLPEGCGGNGKTSCAAAGIAQMNNNTAPSAANDALARFLGRPPLRVKGMFCLRLSIFTENAFAGATPRRVLKKCETLSGWILRAPRYNRRATLSTPD